LAEKLNIVGRTFAGYAVEKKIGAGGMGVVFRAFDERLSRPVALKILPSHLLKDDTTRLRFLREGRSAAKVDHPNCVRLLAAGEEQGWPFLVMEFVDGGTLQGRLDKYTRLSVAETIAVGRQIAAGLGAAHRVGILHRDVKPANVLFTREGEAKLADFGLAREEQCDHSISVTGMVMGTPHYMAPEVCEGKKADPRSDVYALGVMLYQMVSGRYPFDGTAVMEVLMQHVQNPPPPLPEATPALADAIFKAMEKEPKKRYQTAEDLIAALQAAGRDPAAGAGGSSGVRRPETATKSSAGVVASGSALVGPTGSVSALPPISLSMVGPLPRSHLVAYSVAGVAMLLSIGLLVWVFAFGKSGGGGERTEGRKAADGTGAVQQPVDPEVFRKGEEWKRWLAFTARARAAGADPLAMLTELEHYEGAPATEGEQLKTELHERARVTLMRDLETRERQLVELAEADPSKAAFEAQRRTDWPPLPFRRELIDGETRIESKVWDAIHVKVRTQSELLVERGEFRQAYDLWDTVNPPHREKRDRRELERTAILDLAGKEAKLAIRAAPPGAKGARQLRDLARKMPADIANELENAASMKEETEGGEDPLEILRGLVMSRDWDALAGQLDHLEKTAARGMRDRLPAARLMLAGCRQVMADAMEAFRGLSEQAVEIELTDRTTARGTVFDVSDRNDQVTLATAGGQLTVKASDMSNAELVRRATGSWPTQGRLENALDFVLAARDGNLSHELARSLLRRGRDPAPHQVEALKRMVDPETASGAREMLESVARAAADSPEAGASAARRLFAEFGRLPLPLKARQGAKAALARGAQKMDIRDLQLFSSADVDALPDGVFSLRWNDDSFLDDFASDRPLVVDGGEGTTLVPSGDYAYLSLDGLRFRNVTIRMTVKCAGESAVGVIPGYRSVFEGLPMVFSLRSSPGTSRVLLPTEEEPLGIASTEDGWYVIEVSVTEGKMGALVGEEKLSLKLGSAWPGGVALFLAGAVSIRDLSVTGKPEWAGTAAEAEMRDLRDAWQASRDKVPAAPAGSWRKLKTKDTEVVLEAAGTDEMLRPQQAGLGADYLVRFEAKLEGTGTTESFPQMIIDSRVEAKSWRRLLLSGQGLSYVMTNGEAQRTGYCGAMETHVFHEFELAVRGDIGLLAVDGDIRWVGHYGPARSGAPAVGVRNGTLTVRNLRAGPLPR
jgi:serine/threonine-protein kinase